MTEELKSQLDYFKDEPKYLRKIIDELEQENKEEKKAYNECMHYLACMTEQRNKLKTALEEIREIVKPYLTDCQGSLCEPIDEVLKKINEVLK